MILTISTDYLSKGRNRIVMYKLDECQSLNSDTSEHIPIRLLYNKTN